MGTGGLEPEWCQYRVDRVEDFSVTYRHRPHGKVAVERVVRRVAVLGPIWCGVDGWQLLDAESTQLLVAVSVVGHGRV